MSPWPWPWDIRGNSGVMIIDGIFSRRRPLWGTFLTPAWVICTVILIFCINNTALAQLSPGPLSSPHSHLKGLKKCSSCHKLGSREIGDKCLECHQEIAAMRQGGPGMHAGGDFSNCVDGLVIVDIKKLKDVKRKRYMDETILV